MYLLLYSNYKLIWLTIQRKINLILICRYFVAIKFVGSQIKIKLVKSNKENTCIIKNNTGMYSLKKKKSLQFQSKQFLGMCI